MMASVCRRQKLILEGNAGTMDFIGGWHHQGRTNVSIVYSNLDKVQAPSLHSVPQTFAWSNLKHSNP